MALSAVVAPTAEAGFPGTNGAIAFAQRATSGDLVEPTVEHTRIATRHATFGRERILVDCELTAGVPTSGNCTGRSYTSPSYSPTEAGSCSTPANGSA
jgi:hypothetical protein